MGTRRVASALLVATLLGSAAYLFVYLYRWEWNRALIAGVFLLAAEVALAAAVIVRRLGALAAPAPAGRAEPAATVLHRVREAAPPARDHFAWLRDGTEGLGVFVPILMGLGAVLSALAWVVERLARATAGPLLERDLAGRMAAFTLPPGHLLARRTPPADGVELLLGPGRR